MSDDLLKELYELIDRRREECEEGSYTAYLFDAGLDKILKKLGEETAETILAAKNLEACSEDSSEARAALLGETGDLIYHLLVMLSYLEIDVTEVEELLRERMKKTKNLKI